MKKKFKVFVWIGIVVGVLFLSLTIQSTITDSNNLLISRNAEALAYPLPSGGCDYSSNCYYSSIQLCRICNGIWCSYIEGWGPGEDGACIL